MTYFKSTYLLTFGLLMPIAILGAVPISEPDTTSLQIGEIQAKFTIYYETIK